MGTTDSQYQNYFLHQYAQQQASVFPIALGGQLGSAMGETGITTTGTEFYSPQFKNPDRRTIKFHRINQKVELPEGAISETEPLDELRIKVAKWLYN